MILIQIRQAETVYRDLDITRREAIRILTDETCDPVDGLSAMTDQQLASVIAARIEDPADDVSSYLDSQVVEVDSSVEWTVEVMYR